MQFSQFIVFVMALFLSKNAPFSLAGAVVHLPPIPNQPSAPPLLSQKAIAPMSQCERYFVYDGKLLQCDSNTEKDANRLRPIMRDVPEAIAELDAYVANRKSLQTTAYVGSASFLMIIGGIFVSHPAFDPVSGAPRAGGYLILGGVGLAIHSLIYGMSINRANEVHIQNAVARYNSARPDHPIRLQFSADIPF